METLYDRLKEYSESDFYGFHMPGHKRNMAMLNIELPYDIDITEIEGFDDLHHSTGLLKEAKKRAASVYKAEETHFLINGSTVGILSAIMGCTKRGDKILVARNCHKSVYHAIFMQELDPVYIYPEYNEEVGISGEVLAEDVARILTREPEIRAVVIVSPTYDGVVSDVKQIAKIAHDKGVPLIVDEAHGAHFGFHPYFPYNSNVNGADIVIHSLHKTLPALTQTAVLHMNGCLVNRKNVRNYLQMLQTSSPSYVLMSSIDSCIDMLADRGAEIFEQYVAQVEEMREKLADLRCLKLVETEHYDYSKVIISVLHTDMTSKELYRRILEDFHLQVEMIGGTYVLAMTSIGDTKEGFDRLVQALMTIDGQIYERMQKVSAMEARELPAVKKLPQLTAVYTSSVMESMLEEALVDGSKGSSIERLPWRQSVGYISTEYAYLYPPGSPLIVPGERLSHEVIDILEQYEKLRLSIEGMEEEGYIEVWMHG